MGRHPGISKRKRETARARKFFQEAAARKFAYKLAFKSLKNTLADSRGVTGSIALRSKCFDLNSCRIYFFPNFTF
jgi:hypothetical protein